MRAIVVTSILLFYSVAGAAADAATATAPDAALAIYATPATRVDIGARSLNLRCTGSGSPVVVLEAGALADSMTWRLVQPLIAQTTRVCSYDRAGYGFSDDGPQPRNVDAAAADLHALIAAAKIPMPVILVGHSLGTNIVRRYADHYAGDVAGIVLVDPPPQHTSEFSAEWVKADDAQHEQVIAFAKHCEEAAAAGKLANASGDLARCIRPPDPGYPAALNAAIHAQKEKPPFWHTLISEMQTNMTLFEEPVSPKESHGSIPLIVLVADDAFADAPPEGKQAMESARQKTNKAIVATSTRGEQRLVAHSSHDMQLDQPQAVATAVADAIKASRAGAK
ncbi:MAG TPA: alpha/beta hydrolase [Rhodanobacteraceae bacterium]|nr:alpha/beta hydrolase [Rhodanobacteraceae bacterium]